MAAVPSTALEAMERSVKRALIDGIGITGFNGSRSAREASRERGRVRCRRFLDLCPMVVQVVRPLADGCNDDATHTSRATGERRAGTVGSVNTASPWSP